MTKYTSLEKDNLDCDHHIKYIKILDDKSFVRHIRKLEDENNSFQTLIRWERFLIQEINLRLLSKLNE